MGSVPIRDRNLIEIRMGTAARDCDHRYAGFFHILIETGRGAAGCEDQATHSLGAKHLQASRLLLRVLVVTGQEQRVIGLSQRSRAARLGR